MSHRPPAPARRRQRACLRGVAFGLLVMVALGWAATAAYRWYEDSFGPGTGGRASIGAVNQPPAVQWSGEQPGTGVDVSFPQCSRVLRDLPSGFAIVGLDGGMPDRPNPCFATQWSFALRQAGAAVYVNTADNGRGTAARKGRSMARGDLVALAEHNIPPGTPVWLDVELPEVWRGTAARHREVITEHMRVLAEAGYPVGIYSAPALWRTITGNARPRVPVWVGIGTASAAAAERACRRDAFGGTRPAIVQRIGVGSDGLPLDRNLVCPGVDLTGLVRPN